MSDHYVEAKSLYIGKGGLVLWLFSDHPDFWVLLHPTVGWGRFQNVNKLPREEILVSAKGLTEEERKAFLAHIANLPKPTEECFILVEIRPAGAPAPSPVFSLANVLWQKKEALLLLQQEKISLVGECLTFRSQPQ